MSSGDDLWANLPELVRNYAPKDRATARELAYSLFDRFAKAKDEDGMTRLRFALETQEDLGVFYRSFDARL